MSDVTELVQPLGDQDETVVAATERAIKAAQHLTVMDAGVIAALRGLARSVDYLMKSGGLNESGKFDNVTIPTYFRYSEQLGLTPSGRRALDDKSKPTAEGKGSKIAHLKSSAQPASA